MTAVAAETSSSVGVVAALHSRTQSLHTEAERSGVIRDLLRGEASRAGYVALLRNLLPAYRALEQGLDAHRSSSGLAALAAFRLDRAAAIEADLTALCGNDWSETVPLLSAGHAYGARIAAVAEGHGTRLIAHAYTRYLGDLSGGLILRRLLSRSLALRDDQLSFYDFSRFGDPAALKAEFRRALDQAGAHARDPHAVVEEGAIAFQLNIELSRAVKQAVASGAAPALNPTADADSCD